MIGWELKCNLQQNGIGHSNEIRKLRGHPAGYPKKLDLYPGNV